MKKLVITISLLIFVLSLAACGGQTPPTPAEQYLADHTEEEIFAFFDVPAVLEEFADPTDIDTADLYYMLMLSPYDEEQWHYDENTYGLNLADQYGEYRIPLASLTAELDKYFTEYNFVPEEVCDYYDAEKELLVSVIASGYGRAPSEEFVAAAATGDDTISVELSVWLDGEVGRKVLTARIINGEAKVTSLHSEYYGVDETPAEQYLASHSNNELFDYFSVMEPLGDFDDSMEISSRNLRDTVILLTGDFGEDEGWWHPEGGYGVSPKGHGEYQMPLADYTAVLDKYFTEYNFVPEEVCDYYDAQKEVLVCESIDFGNAVSGKFITAQPVSADEIKAKLYLYWGDDYDINYGKAEFIAQIIDGEAKIKSLHITRYGADE